MDFLNGVPLERRPSLSIDCGFLLERRPSLSTASFCLVCAVQSRSPLSLAAPSFSLCLRRPSLSTASFFVCGVPESAVKVQENDAFLNGVPLCLRRPFAWYAPYRAALLCPWLRLRFHFVYGVPLCLRRPSSSAASLSPRCSPHPTYTPKPSSARTGLVQRGLVADLTSHLIPHSTYTPKPSSARIGLVQWGLVADLTHDVHHQRVTCHCATHMVRPPIDGKAGSH